MITDGISTFAIYTYQCGLLPWSGSSNFAVVGYNAQGLAQNAPFSATPTVATQISCRCLPRSLTWYNIIYQLPFTVIPQFYLNTAECIKHYTTDIISHPFSDFQVLNASLFLPICPCSYFQAIWDWRFTSAGFLGSKFSFCFLPRFLTFVPFFGFGPTQLCCYGFPG